MTVQEILEGNRFIAEFMGAVTIETYPDHVLLDFVKKENYPSNDRYCASSLLKYHSDWNWIMSVIKKIESLKNITVGVTYCTCRIWDFTDCLFSTSGETKEEATFLGIIQFIKYYHYSKERLGW